MIRSNTSSKLNDQVNSTTFRSISGNFMTSYLNDQNEFNNDVPIRSPDFSNNDQAILDHDDIKPRENKKFSDIIALQIENSEESDTYAINKQYNSQDLSDKSKTLLKEKHNSLDQCKTISGGLTLDSSNKSLKNLICYIKTSYSNKLNSPKWKNFKGLKLQVPEKIRLNNVIWRNWFEQYGTKTPRKKPSFLCHFAINVDEPVPKSSRMAILEGEYWKRRLGSITKEYKKWREVSRKHLKTYDESPKMKTNLINRHYEEASNSAAAVETNLINNSYPIGISNAQNLNERQLGHLATNANSQQCNNVNYINTAHSYNQNSTNVYYDNNSQYDMSNNTSFINNATPYSTDQSYNFNNMNNLPVINNPDQSSNLAHYPNSTNASKGKCRSPSPESFQDINLYNLFGTSDTLFGTHALEDHCKSDPIFGNNPDLFQPDLMHLYPNFDFFDLDYSDGNQSNTLPSSNSNSSNMNTFEPISNLVQPNSTEIQSTSSSTTDYVYPLYSNAKKNIIHSDSVENNQHDISTIDHAAYAIMPSQNQQPAHSSDNLFNFNTLVSAAASMPSLSSKNELNKANELMQLTAKHSNIPSIKHNELSTSLVKTPQQMKLKQPESLTNNYKLNTLNNGHSMSLHSNDQQSQINGSSSNTIRNLLAQQSSQHSFENSPNSIQTVSNIRPSGVYSLSNSPNQLFPNQTSNKQQTMGLFSNNSSPLLTSNPNQSSPPTNNPKSGHPLYENNVKFKNQHLSSLLTAVLGPSLDNNSKQSPPIKTTASNVSIVNKKAKRGRKVSLKQANESANKESDSEPQLKKSTKIKKVMNNNSLMNEPSEVNMKNMYRSTDYLTDYMNQQKLASMISDDKLNQNHLPNPSVFSYNSTNSNETFLINSEQKEISSKSRTASNQNNDDTITPICRSRSSSINNTTITSDQGLTTAEQKRRCNIQYGFDRLQTLVPSLKETKNSKASKATMLKKTSEYIKELKEAREKRLQDLKAYQNEIEMLSNKVTECQIQLPANGVSVTGNLNKTEALEKKFKSYVQEKTVENWKFYLFSYILKPLFDSFTQHLNMSSKEAIEQSFHEWQEKFCSLVQLRPIVSNYLRQISKSTSILKDSSKLPEECYIAALTKI